MSDIDKTRPVSASPPGSAATRRKFNKGAAAGAAVLLTLGNRVAWGSGGHNGNGSKTKTKTKTKTKVKTACISQQVWASYTNADPSFDPKGKFKKEVSKFENFLQKYQGQNMETFSKGRQTCAAVEVSFEKKVEKKDKKDKK